VSAIPPDRVLNGAGDLPILFQQDMEILLQDWLPVGHRQYVGRLEHKMSTRVKLASGQFWQIYIEKNE
jgi:hypothetical protein